MALTNLSSIITSGITKNYISLGNFENASTLGWSLLHTTLTGVIPTGVGSSAAPFSLLNGATAASANLSFTAIATNPLAGSYSGSLISIAASTPGDMVVSQAYSIDSEDQGKVLTFRFFYEQMSGTALSFTGTSTNSYAIYIYDCDNNVWIQPAGVYSLVQSSGSGYATGSFQTAINATRFQIAIININASAGAFAMSFDDFYVGPSASIQAAIVTQWTPYTPVFSAGFGTVTNINFYWRRVGENIEIRGSAGGGTIVASVAQISMPSGILPDTTETSPASGGNWMPVGIYNRASATAASLYALVTGGSSTISIGNQNSGVGSFTPANVGGTNGIMAGNGESFSLRMAFKVAGWGSSTLMSNDTDTRVVACVVQGNSTTIGTSVTTITPTSILSDTHGAFSGSTYTVPVAGYYQCNISFFNNSAIGSGGFVEAYIIQNATNILVGGEGSQSAGGQDLFPAGSVVRYCNVGDTLKFAGQMNSGTGAASSLQGSIFRLSGPATIAASESVNARAFASTTAITGSLATIVFTTTDYDSHGGYSAGTYTAPISGRYQVNVKLAFTAASAAAGNAIDVQLQKNGTAISEFAPVYQSTQVLLPVQISDEIYLLAGDTVRVQASSAATTPSLVSSNTKNYFSIARVGN